MSLNFKHIELFSKAFADAYTRLDRGQQARLRRADQPTSVGSFWRCWAAAETQTGVIEEGRGRLAGVLSELICVRLLDACAPGDQPGLSFGQWLAAGKQVPERRVEALLSARESQAVTQDLQAIAGFKKSDPKTLDLGSLVPGLFPRQLAPQTTRRWADDFFKAIQGHPSAALATSTL
jgi:CRISPR type I-E-associated protein CasB/Cse2